MVGPESAGSDASDGTMKSWMVLDLPGLKITHEPEDAGLLPEAGPRPLTHTQ